MKKVLIVEDEREIVNIIKDYCIREDFEPIIAYDGQTAIVLFERWNPDILIVDIMLPRMDGFGVLREVRKTSSVPVIILSARSLIEDRMRGLIGGADLYLTKPFEIEELIVRVRALLKRTKQIPKSSAVRELLSYNEITLIPESYSVKINDKIQKLTPIEYDIFNLLFQNHGNMVPGAKLLKDIWGYEPDDNVETIRVHIRHLRAKIDKISDGKKYIETIYGGGYKLNV